MFGFKLLSKLHQKKYRQESGLFIVEGRKGVLEAMDSTAVVEQLITTREFQQKNADFFQLKPAKAFVEKKLVLVLDNGEFRHLSDTETPQEVCAVVRLPKNSLQLVKAAQKIAILEDIRDPGNLGTIIRTADWFGIDALLLVGGADPYQPKVVRASMGSLFHLPLITSSNLSEDVAFLKKSGFPIVVTRPEIDTLPAVPSKFGTKLCLVFGNEAHGTSPQMDRLADYSFSIPRYGAAESLNVAVSFGIVMATFTQKPGK